MVPISANKPRKQLYKIELLPMSSWKSTLSTLETILLLEEFTGARAGGKSEGAPRNATGPVDKALGLRS